MRLRASSGKPYSRSAPRRRPPRRARSLCESWDYRRVARSRSCHGRLLACSACFQRQARHDDGRLPPVLLQLRASHGARLMNSEGGNAWPNIRFGFSSTRLSPDYHLSGVLYGAHNEGHRKLPYGYVLIKGKDQVAMVDVGFNNKEYGNVFASCSASRTGSRARKGPVRVTPAVVDSASSAMRISTISAMRRLPQRHLLHPGAGDLEMGLGDVAGRRFRWHDGRRRSRRYHPWGGSRSPEAARLRRWFGRECPSEHRPACRL